MNYTYIATIIVTSLAMIVLSIFNFEKQHSVENGENRNNRLRDNHHRRRIV